VYTLVARRVAKPGSLYDGVVNSLTRARREGKRLGRLLRLAHPIKLPFSAHVRAYYAGSKRPRKIRRGSFKLVCYKCCAVVDRKLSNTWCKWALTVPSESEGWGATSLFDRPLHTRHTN
jgi:hypothetical protein